MSISSPSSWDARVDVNVTSSAHTQGSVVCTSVGELQTEHTWLQIVAQTSETWHLEVPVRDQVRFAEVSKVFDRLR